MMDSGILGREKNQKTGYLGPQKSHKKGSIMACMTANSRGIDGGRVRSVNATPGMRLSSEFNPRKTDRRSF